MSNYGDILKSILWRLALAGVIGAAGWWLLSTASGGWSAIPRLLLGMSCIIGAAVLIGPPIARLIAEPAGSLFYSGDKFDRPQPVYSIPQSKRMNGKYEEAMSGFEQIAQEYPDQLQAYIEMIDIAIVNMKDPERANRIFQRGISVLKKDSDKEALARVYSAVRTRLKTRPVNLP